jgi:hypothetical protein
MTLNETHIAAKEQTIPYIVVTWYNAYFKFSIRNKHFSLGTNLWRIDQNKIARKGKRTKNSKDEIYPTYLKEEMKKIESRTTMLISPQCK